MPGCSWKILWTANEVVAGCVQACLCHDLSCPLRVHQPVSVQQHASECSQLACAGSKSAVQDYTKEGKGIECAITAVVACKQLHMLASRA